MHELKLAHELMEVVLKKAAENALIKVTRITICAGEASGVEIAFLRHSFEDHLMPASPAEGAELIIAREPLEVKCRDCGRAIRNEGSALKTICPACGGYDLEVIKGMSVRVESIEGE